MSATIQEAIRKGFINENRSIIGNEAPLVVEVVDYTVGRVFDLPLADRLTAEEKEMVRGIYQDYHQKWDCSCNDRESERSFYCFSLLERVFGADFFKEEE